MGIPAARAIRAANNGQTMRDRSMGILSMVVAITLIVGGIGSGALLDPRRMTVLLIVVGLTPVLSRFLHRSPSQAPVETESTVLQTKRATI